MVNKVMQSKQHLESAYNLTVDKIPVGKSFMKHKNNNGARMVS